MCGPRVNSLCNTRGPGRKVEPLSPPGSMELDLHLTSLPDNLFAHESLTITGPQDAVELGYSIILLYMVQCLGLLRNNHLMRCCRTCYRWPRRHGIFCCFCVYFRTVKQVQSFLPILPLSLCSQSLPTLLSRSVFRYTKIIFHMKRYYCTSHIISHWKASS